MSLEDDSILTTLVAAWRSSGGSIQHAPRELLVELCAKRYPQPSKGKWEEPKLTELKDMHGFRDLSEITRLLKRAIKEGIIEFHVKREGRPYGDQLKDCFPHLKNAIVVRAEASFEALLDEYGAAMSRLLDQFAVEKGKAMTVALGGGRPIRAMVDVMKTVDRQIEFVPTNLLSRQNIRDTFDSSYLCLMAHLKSRAKSSAHLRGLPIYEGDPKKALAYYNSLNSLIGYNTSPVLMKCINELDVIFEGVSRLDPEGFTFESFYRHCGLTADMAKDAGGVGHINYSIIDETGSDITAKACAKIFQARKFISGNDLFHPFVPAMSAARYKSLSTSGNTQVVITAGVFHDRGAILAALKGRLCNHLITDEPTAKGLIEEYGRGKN